MKLLVLEAAFRSVPGGSNARETSGEIGVDLPCELAPTPKYPRFDLAIAGTRGVNLKNTRFPREPQPPLGLDQPRPAHSEVGADRGSH